MTAPLTKRKRRIRREDINHYLKGPVSQDLRLSSRPRPVAAHTRLRTARVQTEGYMQQTAPKQIGSYYLKFHVKRMRLLVDPRHLV